MAMLLGATTGHSQWLETKITLPDSLGGAIYPTCLTTDTSERYVYIGDLSGAIYVVDTKARTRVAKLPCGYVYAICTNTRRNKVYAADYTENRVLAISCATNQVVATVPTGTKPTALCYNSIDDKIYVANYGSGDLTIIDCPSDSAITTIHLGKNAASLCYNPASNRVFCVTELHWGEENTLAVIDGATDSVVATYAGAWWRPMAVNAVANKVYLGSIVLDGTTGAVLDTLRGGGAVLCLNSRSQKLYSIDHNVSEVSVFDCTADTLVARLRHLGVEDVFSMACDTIADRVYVTGYSATSPLGLILVIDGVADTVAVRMPGPYNGKLLASSKRGRMYSTDFGGPELAVFDTGADSLLRTIFIGGASTHMCYDSLDDKVYYVNRSVLGEVGAIDAVTNQPVGHVQVGPHPQSVVWHAPTNRVYCGGSRNITVIDPTADTVTKVLAVRGHELCSAPRVNKVYAYAYDGVDYVLTVIDCRNDSVVKTIPIPTTYVFSMCYVAYDKLYIGGSSALTIIDCVGDTLIRSYPFANSRVVAGRDGKRVYCWRPYSLCTFDAAGDTLVAEVPWDAPGGSDLLYVPALNKVYCVCGGYGQDCMLVADGETDSVIAQIPIPVPYANALGYDSASGLVYCGHQLDSVVTFFDSRTDSVVGSESTGLIARTFITVPAHNRVYVGGYGNSFIPVIRTDPPGVEEAALPRTKNVVRPTIVSRNSPLVVHHPSVLLDAVGRKVFDAKPGPYGLTGCRAGVYFLRGRTDGEVVKILLVD
jgi:YVTN family beta-propeller protein